MVHTALTTIWIRMTKIIAKGDYIVTAWLAIAAADLATAETQVVATIEAVGTGEARLLTYSSLHLLKASTNIALGLVDMYPSTSGN